MFSHIFVSWKHQISWSEINTTNLQQQSTVVCCHFSLAFENLPFYHFRTCRTLRMAITFVTVVQQSTVVCCHKKSDLAITQKELWVWISAVCSMDDTCHNQEQLSKKRHQATRGGQENGLARLSQFSEVWLSFWIESLPVGVPTMSFQVLENDYFPRVTVDHRRRASATIRHFTILAGLTLEGMNTLTCIHVT